MVRRQLFVSVQICVTFFVTCQEMLNLLTDRYSEDFDRDMFFGASFFCVGSDLCYFLCHLPGDLCHLQSNISCHPPFQLLGPLSGQVRCLSCFETQQQNITKSQNYIAHTSALPTSHPVQDGQRWG